MHLYGIEKSLDPGHTDAASPLIHNLPQNDIPSLFITIYRALQSNFTSFIFNAVFRYSYLSKSFRGKNKWFLAPNPAFSIQRPCGHCLKARTTRAFRTYPTHGPDCCRRRASATAAVLRHPPRRF